MNAQLRNSCPAATGGALRDAYLRSAADDSPAALDVLLGEQPHCVPAHLLRIAKLVVAKDLRAFPALERALATVQPHLARADEREHQHIAAATSWLAHKPLLAAHQYSTISANDPHDLLALRLAQSCWFFLGRRMKVHGVAARALRAWSPRDAGYDIAVAMLGFGCDEIGDAVGARASTTRALELEPRNVYAIHAHAHALGTAGQSSAVLRALRARRPQWRIGGRLDSHVAWHEAVAEVQTGGGAAARMLRDELLPLAVDGPSAAADATDLAWRLELARGDVDDAWAQLATAWESHHAPGFWPPYDILAGLAYLRAGRRDLIGALRRRLQDGPYFRPCAPRAARMLTLPSLAAIESFVAGAFATAETLLRETIDRMSGSLLQRELFEVTLSAARRSRAPYATRPAALRIRA